MAALALIATSSIAQLSVPVYELKQWQNGWRLSGAGFGTLGAVFSDSDTYAFRRTISQNSGATKGSPSLRSDSLLGLQLMANYRGKFSSAVQVKWNQGHHKDTLDYVSMAFVGWQLSPALRLRLGRTPVDAYMASEFRDVGITFPAVRPPSTFYGFSLLDTVDGIDLSFQHRLGQGYINYRLAGGRIKSYISTTDRSEFELKLDKVWSGNLLYETSNWNYRIGYLYSQINQFDRINTSNETPSGINLDVASLVASLQRNRVAISLSDLTQVLSEYELANSHLTQYSAGIKFDNGTWIAQVEATRTAFDKMFALTADAGYASLAYHYGRLTPYITLAAISSKMKDADSVLATPVAGLQAAFDETLNRDVPQAKQTSFTLGTRWDVNQRFDLKLQWSRHRVTAGKSSLWLSNGNNHFPPSHKEAVNILSISLDFVL